MDIEEVKALTHHYGGGYNYFNGQIHQRGYGIGSFLGGMFRGLIPLFKSGSKMIGRELLTSASNILNDLNTNQTDFKSSLKHNGLNALRNLTIGVADKMKGGKFVLSRKRKRTTSGVTKTIAKRAKITHRKKTLKRKPSSTKKPVKKRRSRRVNRKSKSSSNNLNFLD